MTWNTVISRNKHVHFETIYALHISQFSRSFYPRSCLPALSNSERTCSDEKKEQALLDWHGSKVKNEFPWAGNTFFTFFIVRVRGSVGMLSRELFSKETVRLRRTLV